MIVRRFVAIALTVLALFTAVVVGADVSAGLGEAGTEREGRGGPRSLVRTDAGWVRGAAGDGHVTFSGIPYAAPPVGERRWAPPATAAPWRGVRDATAPGPSCPQPAYGPDGRYVAGDEDCLVLDVTAPTRARRGRGGLRPVVVWVHGGGFRTGAGSEYGAAELATAGDVVVVTVNYRLGALGFLSSPVLDAEGHASGNYGLEDQVAALRWVRRNAAAFGGDPGNVTLAGQSSGARAVCAHLASPASDGLFHRAILQSSLCGDLVTKPVADERGARVASELGCDGPGTDVAACLRARPVADVLDTLEDVAAPLGGDYAGEPWQAVAGTPVLPDQPLDALAAGSAAGVPVLLGTMRDEMRAFVAYGLDEPLTAEGYRARLVDAYGDDATAVLARYPVEAYASPTVALATVFGDEGAYIGACPALAAAEAAAAHTDAVYAYEMLEDSGVPAPDGTSLGAYHGWDLPFLFDVRIPGSQYPELTPAQQDLSVAVVGYWSAFARTGDPNGGGRPDWPAFGEGGTVLGLATGEAGIEGGIAPTDLAGRHACDLWSVVGRPGRAG